MHVRYAFLLMILVSLPHIFFSEHDSGGKRSLFKARDKGRKRENKKATVEKRNRIDDIKFFEGISENAPTGAYSSATKPDLLSVKHRHSKEDSLNEIKSLLAKLLEKIDEIENGQKGDPLQDFRAALGTEDTRFTRPRYSEQTTIPNSSPKLSLIQRIERRRRKKDRKEEKRQRWGKWTNWSPCSVSCGKGREIRWRHCLENCDVAETEMEEKTCQLPACGPTKLFGVIKL